MRLVQLANDTQRQVAQVEGSSLHLLSAQTVYELATQAINAAQPLATICAENQTADSLNYNAVYHGASDWRLLPSFDHPSDPAHCLVSGTGLTHMKSAENRSAMHGSEVTDSMRMYYWGVEGGNPPEGEIGMQPEWFYKGDGSILRAHGESLPLPAYAEDGGEEPEVAGVYLIGQNGLPHRLGFTVGNEFSDHKMERRNYLYLAHSKLRNCAIGPELIIDEPFFDDLSGTVKVRRREQSIWEKPIRSGQNNMCHSLANLEHHHFKYPGHRRPGDVHIHFFGADAFSFGDGLALADGDIMEISFPALGRPLRNPIAFSPNPQVLVKTHPL